MSSSLLPSLKSASLLPSPIIPASFTPSVDLTITFPTISPAEGSLARVSDVAQQPKISISNSDSAQSYTLLLIDPDAPTPADPKFSYWRHWVVINIPSTSSSSASSDVTENGTTLTPYLAPGPKDGSGPHRYLFLLFKEKDGWSVKKEDVGGVEFVDRRSFKAREFVEGHGLELVGVQWIRGVGDGWVKEKGEL